MQIPRETLLDERQAAYFLSCSVFSLQRQRRIGSPIPYVKIGRRVKYRLSELEKYLQERTYTSTSQYENNGGRDAE